MNPPSNTTALRRRWFRYSLRTLLVLITVAAVWLGILSYRANVQRAAVKKVLALGGGVSYAHQWDYSGRFSREIKGAGPPGPKWLRDLIGDHYFVDVTFVRVNRPDAADTDIEQILKLPHLKGIGLVGTGASDVSLTYIRSRATLRWLYLDRTSISDAGLAQMRELPNLESLSLAETAITDSGLIHLSPLGNLQELNLSNTAVSDAGLAVIGKLTSLKQLYLYHTNISDEGLPNLQSLTNLDELGLSGTRVTSEGVQRLRLFLPKTEDISHER